MGNPPNPAVQAKDTVELLVRVLRPNGEPVNGAEVTVEGLNGPPRKEASQVVLLDKQNQDGWARFLLSSRELDGVTGDLPVTARKPISGPVQHGVNTQEGKGKIPVFQGATLLGPGIVFLKDPCLERFPDPQTDTIPAWNLTLDQAIRTLVWLHAQREIILIPEPVFQHESSDCKLVNPNPNLKLNPDPKVTLSPDNVAKTVNFRNCNFPRIPFKHNEKILTVEKLGPIQPRNAVGFYRLAKFLGRDSEWGVTTILHISVLSPGRHSRGHCLDFSGVIGKVKAGPFTGNTLDLHVQIDWGAKPTPAVDNQGNVVSGKPPQFDYPRGQNFPKLPYRLAKVTGADPMARDFFQQLYRWLSQEYPVSSSQRPGTFGPPSSPPPAHPGAIKGLTIHPDYPDVNTPPDGKDGREAHNNHIHVEMPEGPL